MRARTVLLILLVLLIAVSAVAAVRPAKAKPAGKATPGAVKPQWWGGPPNQIPAASGKVAAVAPDKITLDVKHGRQTFAVTPETKVRVRGKAGAIGDVKVGDPCRIVFKPVPNGVPIAEKIQVPKPSVAGEIVARNGRVLTLKGKEATWTVTLAEGAKITCRKYIGTLDDLRIGYWAAAGGEINGTAVLAKAVSFRPTVVHGAVTEVNGNLITVKAVKQHIVTGQVTDKTQILVRPRVGPNKPGTLADIKVGAPVNVAGHLMEGGPMQLLFVDVLTGI